MRHNRFVVVLELLMKRFIEGEDRAQATLFPACLEDYISEDNPVRVIDAFVDELDLHGLGSMARSPRSPADRPITQQRCSSYTSTAI